MSRAAFFGVCGLLGALELLLAFQETVVGCATTLACIGGAFSCFTANASATLQLRMPESIRTRMLSLYSYIWIGTAPLSGLLAGWLSDRGGPTLVFSVGGVTMTTLAAMAALGWQSQWRSAASRTSSNDQRRRAAHNASTARSSA